MFKLQLSVLSDVIVQPKLTVFNLVIDTFKDNSQPDSQNGTVVVDNGVQDMMIYSGSSKIVDGDSGYKVWAATTCQYDSEPTNVMFKHTSCRQLDVRVPHF